MAQYALYPLVLTLEDSEHHIITGKLSPGVLQGKICVKTQGSAFQSKPPVSRLNAWFSGRDKTQGNIRLGPSVRSLRLKNETKPPVSLISSHRERRGLMEVLDVCVPQSNTPKHS